jgi:sugar transferase (PEP-CTERM/EpsH1 system associated)
MSREILFIGHRIPFPPNRGDKIRSNHVLKELARLAPVHVACFADDDGDLAEEVELASIARSYQLVRRSKPLALAGLQALALRKPVSLTAFYHAQLATYVRDLVASGRIGTIYVFSSQMGQYVPEDFAGRLVVDFVDVDSAKFAAYAEARGPVLGWVDAREARLLRNEEARLAARADLSLLISKAEAELFSSRMTEQERAASTVRVVGNGIDSGIYDPALVPAEGLLHGASGPRLIFTGQMDYAPNVAAVLRVARRILPLVRKALPGASFHIVGRNPAESVLELEGAQGVKVWGRVPDMRPWLRAADIAVVPLEIARGVQNKVLEAMAMALPVVLTGAAASGIDATAGEHFAVADSDEDIAEALIALATDHARAQAMGEAARRFVVERQSWQSALAPLAGIIAGRADIDTLPSAPARATRDAA